MWRLHPLQPAGGAIACVSGVVMWRCIVEHVLCGVSRVYRVVRVCLRCCSDYFTGRNFRGEKVSRGKKNAKFLGYTFANEKINDFRVK